MSNKGSNTIFIKPAKSGAKVHLEGKGREFLPEEGAQVQRTNCWVRRLRDGSVLKMDAEQVTALKRAIKAKEEAAKKAAAEAKRAAAEAEKKAAADAAENKE